ncbi:MAG: hypothetical protein V4719_20570 [Planctomycetota bacterium]
MLLDQITEFGWALVPGLIDRTGLDQLRAAADVAVQSPRVRSRRGSAFGLRHLLQLMPAARDWHSLRLYSNA